jgi:hypothetical protein
MEKMCIIENAQFSYILYVDGQEIGFYGAANADYFENHYKQLGYKIEKTKTFKG